MKFRAMIGAVAAAGACLLWAGGGAVSAQAATTCTWGGTPAAPTGTFTLKPGITNTPSAGPLAFRATGDLAGGAGCTGKLVYDGQFDAGSSCLAATFHVAVKGLPGVERAVGTADNLVPAPALLYDADGNVVGSELAQIVAQDNVPHYTDCTNAAGFTWGRFSSVVELF
jgi:hypothetical protein